MSAFTLHRITEAFASDPVWKASSTCAHCGQRNEHFATSVDDPDKARGYTMKAGRESTQKGAASHVTMNQAQTTPDIWPVKGARR